MIVVMKWTTPASFLSLVWFVVVVQHRGTSSSATGSGWKEEGPEGAVSLAFVLDVTGSMHDDLMQVMDGADRILNVTLREKEATFYSYVLVPFHDPVVGPAVVTRDPEEFRRKLRELTVHGGGDCPEMSVTAMGEALKLSLPSSYIYVFTDARAKDYHLLEPVLDMIQQKGSQVVIVMTGDCGDPEHPGYLAYRKIAATSSGQVFHLNKTDVDEVLGFVEASIRPRKVNLVSLDASSDAKEDVKINVDSSLVEFTVSVTGRRPRISLVDPRGSFLKQGEDLDVVLDLENVIVVSVKEPMPGQWTLSVTSDVPHSVRSSGTSELSFVHGFSRGPAASLEGTYRRPVTGTPTYVLVNATNRGGRSKTVFTTLELLNTEGQKLKDVPLHRMLATDTMYNATPFVPPDEYFYLKVVGKDQAGFSVQRMTPTAIKSRQPDVLEVDTLSMVHSQVGRNVVLRCRVRSSGPFVARWFKDGLPASEPQEFEQSAEVPLRLSRVSANDQGVYACNVSNDAVTAGSVTFLEVTGSPAATVAPTDVSAHPGRTVVLACAAGRAGDQVHRVVWHRLVGNATHRTRGQLKSARFKSTSNASLVVRSVQVKDAGTYECVVAEGSSRGSWQRFRLRVYDVPKVTLEPDSLQFRAGDTVKIRCTASGYPDPQVWWDVPQEQEGRITTEGSTLLLHSACSEDEDLTVACVARNQVGSDVGRPVLTYVEPPRITLRSDQVVGTRGERTTLHCDVTGAPMPRVRWTKDGVDVDASTGISYDSSGTLLIRAVQESHAGQYTCVASSSAGTDQAVITFEVRVPPSIANDTLVDVIRVPSGSSTVLECSAEGSPSPTLSWFKDELSLSDSDPDHIRTPEGLRVNAVTLSVTGKYTCLAENSAGSARKEYILDVLVPPGIGDASTDSSSDGNVTVLEVLEGLPVTLRCLTTGHPSPDVTWFKDEALVPPHGLRDVEIRQGGETLLLGRVSSENSGHYVCRATNDAGTAFRNYTVRLVVPARIHPPSARHQTVSENNSLTLPCNVSGLPRPDVSWLKDNGPIDRLTDDNFIYNDTTHSLSIVSAQRSHSGKYTCIATNNAGSAQETLLVEVYVAPRIEKSSDQQQLSVVVHHTATLECPASGVPSPSISWFHDGAPVLDSDPDVYFFRRGRTLSLRAVQESAAGIYTCEALSVAGYASLDYVLEVLVPPEIYRGNLSQAVVVTEGASVTLHCPAKGSPEPTVTWLKDSTIISSTPEPSIMLIDHNRYLRLDRVTEDDRGVYICVAANEAGTDEQSFKLDVRIPPKLDPSQSWSESVLVVQNRPVVLQCPAIGVPPPSIRWLKNGHPLNARADPYVKVSADGRRLRLLRVQQKDNGNYSCVAVNEVGRLQQHYVVRVQVPPQVKKRVSRIGGANSCSSGEDDLDRGIHLLKNSSVVLECQTSGDPPPRVLWMKDGVPLDDSNDRVTVSTDRSALEISAIRVSDRGKYTCIASNRVGAAEEVFNVDVLVSPVISGPSREMIEVSESRPLALDCDVESLPRALVYWTKNGKPYELDSTLHVGPHLVIPRARPSDKGVYACVAENEAGLAEKSFEVEVHVPPRVQASEKMVLVVEMEPAQLHCRITGSPQPSFAWLYEGKALDLNSSSASNVTLAENGRILRIANASLDHSGKYTCIGSNLAGTATAEMHLSVAVPPEIAKEKSVVEALLHHPATLNCDVKGYPSPVVEWSKEGELLQHGPLLRTVDGGRLLQILRATEDLEGAYVCSASNTAGSDEHTFFLMVSVPPKLEDLRDLDKLRPQVLSGKDIQMECFVYGRPTPHLNWLKDGKAVTEAPGRVELLEDQQTLYITQAHSEQAGRYTCIASNSVGVVSRDYHLEVLSPPVILGLDGTREVVAVTLGGYKKLTCASVGTPQPLLSWHKDGHPLSTSSPLVRIASNSSASELELKQAQVSDTGHYVCRAANAVGWSEKHFAVTVLVPASIHRTGHRREVDVICGRNVTLECPVRGIPWPSISWFKEGAPIYKVQHGNPRYTFLSEGQTLVIQSTTAADTGSFTCEAANLNGSDSVEYDLAVIEPPGFGEAKEDNSVVRVMEGENVVIGCPVVGHHRYRVTVVWQHNGHKLNGYSLPANSVVSVDKRSLKIAHAEVENSGSYTCVASNVAGENSFTVLLEVLVPPSIVAPANRAVRILEHDSSVLDCQFEGSGQVVVSWYKDGEPLADTRENTKVLPDKRRLRIINATVLDSGTYVCEAVNEVGVAYANFTVEVFVPPCFDNSIAAQQNATEGAEVVLQCPASGRPEPRVSWYKYNRKVAAATQSLRLGPVKIHDAGTYRCTAINTAGIAEINISLAVFVAPSIRGAENETIETVTVTVGSPARLSCESSGIPLPTVAWYHENRSPVKTSQDTGGHFLFFSSGVRMEDSGVYICVAENAAGRAEKKISLAVISPPSIDDAVESHVKIKAVKGHNVSLRCSASGNPAPTLSWLRNGRAVGVTENTTAGIEVTVTNGSILHITNVDSSDAGQYICLANNEGGIASITYHVEVVVPPYFLHGDPTEPSSQHKVLLNHPFSLTCDPVGVPHPTFSWNHDGAPLPRDSLSNVVGNRLDVTSASESSSGMYHCEASNVAGSTQQSFNVTVLVPPQISESKFPIFVSAVSCQPVAMECPAKGVPEPTVVWRRARENRSVSGDQGQLAEGRVLQLSAVQPSDAGTYLCEASNEAGLTVQEFVLTVLVSPKIREVPEAVQLTSGERFVLECISDGYPPPSLSWTWDGPFSPQTSSAAILSFDNTVKEHEGVYTCSATNDAGSDKKSVTITVLVPPSIQSSNENIATVLRQPAILPCNALGDPLPTVSWYKDSEELRDDSDVYEILPNGLYIYEASASDSGNYWCTAENSVGTARAIRRLRVLEPPVITTFPTHEQIVMQNGELSLTCEASGLPTPSVRWERNGAPVTAFSSRYILVNGKELRIPFLLPEDTGEYKCLAENEAGTDTKATLVTVYVPPVIMRDEGEDYEVTSQRGATATLRCRADGYPPPRVTWTREGDPLLSSRFLVQSSGDLLVTSVQAQDTGSYTCTAENEAGTSDKVTSLVVLVPPSIQRLPRDTEVRIGDRLELHCEAEGFPTPRIIWLHNGARVSGADRTDGDSVLSVGPVSEQDKGTYACVAENDVGQLKAVADVRVGVPSFIVRAPSSQVVGDNETVTLHCLVEGDPFPQVFWLKDGKQVHPDEHVQQLRNNSLVVQHAEAKDTGQYRCVASNKHGIAEAVARLTVKKVPQFEVKPQGGIVDLGAALTLDCRATGQPKPELRWTFGPGRRKIETGERFDVYANGTLRILALQAGDEGIFRCVASNAAGSSSADATIGVKLHGQWSSWSPWSECGGACGGSRVRRRLCDNPAPRHGGRTCEGEDSEALPCRGCSAWTEWEAWSVCSVTCGSGTRKRKRRCRDTRGSLASDCPGPDTDHGSCIIVECPVNGGWDDWNEWSPCTSTCGPGYQERTRQCNSPLPDHGGALCVGQSSEVRRCHESPCHVHGGWSPWSPWSHCSASCGGGTRSRSRNCDSPPPALGGRACVGSAMQVDFCNPQSCPVDGGWSEWSLWGQCSASCGRGQRRRFRTCDKPVPSYGGRSCLGDDTDTGECPYVPCQGVVEDESSEETDYSIEQLGSVQASSDGVTPCPPGSTSDYAACHDVDECLSGEKCQHECRNTVGSYECVCPRGYRLAPDAISCHDIDECTEQHIKCGKDEMCINTRGNYKCVDVRCPPGYQRDMDDGSCKRNCDQASCANGEVDLISFKMAALPSNVKAGDYVLRLAAYKDRGTFLHRTVFSVLSTEQPFSVHLSNGWGFVQSAQDLPPGALYRVTVHAASHDDANATLLFNTRILIFISTSKYPY